MVTPGGERVKTLNKKDEGCEKKKQTNKQTKQKKYRINSAMPTSLYRMDLMWVNFLRELKVLPRNAVSRYKCNCNK